VTCDAYDFALKVTEWKTILGSTKLEQIGVELHEPTPFFLHFFLTPAAK
jgi:hypothetical protein